MEAECYVETIKRAGTIIMEVAGNWAKLNFMISWYAKKRLKIE